MDDGPNAKILALRWDEMPMSGDEPCSGGMQVLIPQQRCIGPTQEAGEEDLLPALGRAKQTPGSESSTRRHQHAAEACDEPRANDGC
jgi:hypothetical protein